MSEPAKEIEKEMEGTWEEVVEHSSELSGHRVHLSLLEASESGKGTTQGATSFKGRQISDFDAYMKSIPHFEDDPEFQAFERAIHADRAERRRLNESIKDGA